VDEDREFQFQQAIQNMDCDANDYGAAPVGEKAQFVPDHPLVASNGSPTPAASSWPDAFRHPLLPLHALMRAEPEWPA
jgi:hypothetical protein